MKYLTVVVRVLNKPETIQHSVSVTVRGALSDVWRALGEPKIATRISSSVIAAGHCGDARGVGEVQWFMHRLKDGRAALTAQEVVKHEPERRVVTMDLTTGGLPSGTELTIEPVGPDSCEVTLRSWLIAPAGTSAAVVKQLGAQLRAESEDSARGLAREFPAPADGG